MATRARAARSDTAGDTLRVVEEDTARVELEARVVALVGDTPVVAVLA